MALTLESEQRLYAAGLVQFFEDHRTDWTRAAKETYKFVQENFPEGANIRPDDVAKPLKAIVEVDTSLRSELNEHKLKQKFWISDFTDLIIDRAWDEIIGDGA